MILLVWPDHCSDFIVIRATMHRAVPTSCVCLNSAMKISIVTITVNWVSYASCSQNDKTLMNKHEPLFDKILNVQIVRHKVRRNFATNETQKCTFKIFNRRTIVWFCTITKPKNSTKKKKKNQKKKKKAKQKHDLACLKKNDKFPLCYHCKKFYLASTLHPQFRAPLGGKNRSQYRLAKDGHANQTEVSKECARSHRC